MSSHPRLFIVLSVFFGIALSGCGSSDQATTQTTVSSQQRVPQPGTFLVGRKRFQRLTAAIRYVADHQLRQKTDIPILLPTVLPNNVSSPGSCQVTGSVTKDSYEINFCCPPVTYSESCNEGNLSATRGKKPTFLPNTRLTGDIEASVFLPHGCGHCGPPLIEFKIWNYRGIDYDGGVHYQLSQRFEIDNRYMRSQGKDLAAKKSATRQLSEAANSAIAAGPQFR